MNKASGSVSTKPTNRGVTYNGSNQNLCNAGSGTGTMMYKLGSGSWGTSIPVASTAGSYTVYYKASASTNYNESSSGSVTCTIAKAAGSVTTAPTAKSLEWTGSAQALVNAGSGTGTMLYYGGSNSSWSTSIPTGTNAGSYTIYYKASASTNYNESSSGSVAVTIAYRYMGHDFVDLGLPSGRKWATMNIGASSETGYGSYFSWGNVAAHSGSEGYFTSNNYTSTSGYSLRTDVPANATYDAARKIWTGNWRMPTGAEFRELFDNCYIINSGGTVITSGIIYTTMNGVVGLLLQSKTNSRRIFFPYGGGCWPNASQVASQAYYWASTLHEMFSGVPRGKTFRLRDTYIQGNEGTTGTYGQDGYYGFMIRPVF